MNVESVLGGITCFADLPRVAAALGCGPAWEEIPFFYWANRREEPLPLLRSALIGYLGELPWYGIETVDPARVTRAAARRLMRRGEPAALVGLDPAARELTLAVAFEGTPLVTLIPAVELEIVRACFLRIPALAGDSRLAAAARIAEVLSTEGVGARFFTAFETQLERMAGVFTGRRPEERRSLALLQLNRVLFLYFVQSKGWLDGKIDFLRVQVDRCLAGRRQLDRHLLRPLFFGTLNRPTGDRSSTAREFGRIPFLNGGLFEPHPLERGWDGSIPNPVWLDAFDHLFERFQFTAVEAAGTAIAPDMLGRVFEGVMVPQDRRKSGTFYTPPLLVRALLDQCLLALVSARLGVTDSQAEELIGARDPATVPIFQSLALLDPAAGSGAFLLSALERLTDLTAPDDQCRSETRRRILQTNLFGVDINPTAVRLTELRLWLAVIADHRSGDPGRVAPLPNLDCLIRQGDSLTDPLGLIARMPFRAGSMGTTLAGLRLTFSNATGPDKRAAARELRLAELEAMRECLRLAERQLQCGMDECLGSARDTDLFGTTRGADAMISRRLAELRRKITPIRQARRRLEQEGEIGWFQYESHFADVFARRGGFDVVVGNPPWVRAEKLPPLVREQLSQRYHWWRSDGGKVAGYRHQPDLAVAFLERAHELAAPGGVVGLLVPAKIATAAYGAATRRAMTRDLTLHAISDLESAYPRAFDATVYPMALVSCKRRPSVHHAVRLSLGSENEPPIEQRELAGGGPWILRHSTAAAIARDLARRFPRIQDRFPVRLGVKTGANDVFLNPPATIEPSVRRQAFRGRDLRAFRIIRTVPMLWPCDQSGAPLEKLPPGAHAHVRANERRLRARVDYDAGPPWILFRTPAACPQPKVVWADLARRLTAVALTEPEHLELIPLNTCYVMLLRETTVAQALAAWLNSTWIRSLALLVADPASSGFARFNARTVGALPLPDGVYRDHRLAEWARKAAHHDFDQCELDDLTASHLGLAPAEFRTLASVARDGADHRR